MITTIGLRKYFVLKVLNSILEVNFLIRIKNGNFTFYRRHDRKQRLYIRGRTQITLAVEGGGGVCQMLMLLHKLM